MSMQIKFVVLYNSEGLIRKIKFNLGSVNIITGSSDSGKSAIIRIIEYCLGESEFKIPEGVIRTNVDWYGILLRVNELDVFIAKPKPDIGKTKQNRAYMTQSENMEIPPYNQLLKNHTDNDIRQNLSRLLRKQDPSTKIEQQRQELMRTSLEHTLYYLFQESSVISNKDIIFHKQQEQGIPQEIKETLPYFLGIVDDNDLVQQRQLEDAQTALRKIRSRLRQMEAILEMQHKSGLELIKEAQEIGLIEKTIFDLEDSSISNLLSQELSWQPPIIPGVEDERVLKIQNEVSNLRIQYRSIQEEITATELYIRASDGYSNEVNEQLLRLESIEIFTNPDDLFSDICPLCNSKLQQAIPQASDIQSSLRKLTSDLQFVQQEKPALQEYLSNLLSLRENIRRQISDNNSTMNQILAEQERTKEVFQQALTAGALANRVIGKISQYKSTAITDDELNSLREQERLTQMLCDELKRSINTKDAETDRDRVINLIGEQMTEWSKTLNLNPRGLYRLDLKRLMVYVDADERSIPMNQIGGGKNILGCHLIALFALHQIFITRNRPVPSFVVLDQPAQGFFPTKRDYDNWDGKQVEIDNLGAELASARKMFEFLFEVCQLLNPRFQIIVLEHANFDDDKFRNALIEDPWTSDNGLLQSNWKIENPHISQLEMFGEEN